MKNFYENKYFSVLGDSISTLEWYTVPEYAAYYDTEKKLQSGVLTPAYTWWGQVIEHFGGKLLVNNSFSGSTVCKRAECEIESYGCSDERTSGLHRDDIFPDVIMVFMGMNDWGYGIPSILEREEQKGALGVFSEAYAAMLEKLRKNYPEAELWCFTLPKGKHVDGSDFPYYYGGRHIEEYCNVIINCAKRFDCRAVDLYHFSEPYGSLDRFHPNEEGMKTISHAVILQIEKEMQSI
jgi:hypothetical protein